METALGDSAHYEVLPFEEFDELKREHTHLISRIEAGKRKLALETKLRDAAQSLNKLYTTKHRSAMEEMSVNGNGRIGSPEGTRKHQSRAQIKADEELAASTRKCEELAQDLWKSERRAQELEKKMLRHTAGVLQMTHRGLKKNLNKDGVPRGLESLYGENGLPNMNGLDEFDERSFYKPADYLDEYGGGLSRTDLSTPADAQLVEDLEQKLAEVNNRLQIMVMQVNPDAELGELPQPNSRAIGTRPGAQLDASLVYLQRGLDALDGTQSRAVGGSGVSVEQAQKLEELNRQLHRTIGKASTGQSPLLSPPPAAHGNGFEEQIDYLGAGLNGLEARVERLNEQHAILKTQIQQQRELNNKSDKERDAHIADLTEQLAHSKDDFNISESEVRAVRNEMDMIVEQLDAARQELSLRDQQQNIDGNKALEAERAARQQAEQHFLAELKTKQTENEELASTLNTIRSESEMITNEMKSKETEIMQLQASLESLQTDLGARSQAVSRLEATVEEIRQESDLQAAHQSEQLRTAVQAHEQAEKESKRLQGEMEEIESKFIAAQTELTIVRAELDGAYGTRAERAAEVAANPAIQRELDGLKNRNNVLAEELTALKASHASNSGTQERVEALEKELKETIEDYEAMTKASIEFERERDTLEGTIDGLRDRCESLELQLNDEKLRWLGVKSPMTPGPTPAQPEPVSTMVLKTEFKKMMRESRMESLKAIRVSSILFLSLTRSQTPNMNITTGRTRRTPQTRSSPESAQERTNTTWQVRSQPEYHGLMNDELLSLPLPLFSNAYRWVLSLLFTCIFLHFVILHFCVHHTHVFSRTWNFETHRD